MSKFNKKPISASSSNYKITNKDTEKLSKNISAYNDIQDIINIYNDS